MTERHETLGRLTAALLHDLQQPLTNLTINAERLAELVDERGPSLAAELPELSRDLVAGCRALSAMTRGLQQLMRGHEPVDPVSLVRYAIGACRETTVRTRARLRYDGPSALPKVRVDAIAVVRTLLDALAPAAERPDATASVRAVDGGATIELSLDGTLLTALPKD